MNSLVVDGFQYPENPEWSVHEDEKQGMIERIESAKRLWPLLRVMRIFAPVFRDILCGFIAEDGDQPVGLINFMRQRNEPEWFIANVTVLPAFRRRGIARKLVEATITELRDRKARAAFLEVVAGNDPAFRLYKQLGFEEFTTSSEYQYQKDIPVEAQPMPEGYSLKSLSRFDWQTRFVFAKRVTPSHITRYEPVTEERFRTPLLMALFINLFETVGGSRSERFALYSRNKAIVGIGQYTYRTRPGGVNFINVTIDPKHPKLSEFILRHAFSTTQETSPGHRIQLIFEDWETDLIQCAQAVGCEKRFGSHRMGLRF